MHGHLTEHEDLDLWEQAYRTIVPNGVNYLVFQQEVAPTTGTRHIQGFVALSQQKRAHQVGALFKVLPTAFQATNGTAAQNRGYCTDDDKRAAAHLPFEFGTLPGANQGKRTDLDAALTLLKPGQGVKRLIEDHGSTYARYHGGLDKVGSHYKSRRCKSADKLIVSLYVIWGTPGSGKTTWAHSYDPGNTYEMPDPVRGGTVWMPDYDGERTLLIPDFDGEYGYGTLKRMMDGTYIKFQNKGGHNYAEWDSVVITSNFHPREWYPKERSDCWIYDNEQGYPGPLQRRITNIVQFEGIWPDVTCTIDGTVLEGMPPTRTTIRSAQVTHPSPPPSPFPATSDSYRANQPLDDPPTPPEDSRSPPSPPPDKLPTGRPTRPARLADLEDPMDELLNRVQNPDPDETDDFTHFIDDTEFYGIPVPPSQFVTGIPPSWIDDEADLDDDIVW